MPHQYCTLANVIAAKLPDVDPPVVDDEPAGKTLVVQTLIGAASLAVDNYCKRPIAYFSPAAVDDEDPPTPLKTMRRFTGEGARFLRLPIHIADGLTIEGVSSDLIYEHPENGWIYYEGDDNYSGGELDDDAYIYESSGENFFKRGRIYKVTAAWGFAETPPDVVEATMQLVEYWFERGQGLLGQVTPAGFTIERDAPPPVKMLLAPYIKTEFEIV